MVCKEMINKDKNNPWGTKKLLDAMEWPEGIENWKGNTELKTFHFPPVFLWGISIKRAWATAWNQMYNQAHRDPSVGVS